MTSQARQGNRSPSPAQPQFATHALNIEEVRRAWNFLSPDGHESMTKSAAYDRLTELFPGQLTAREVKALIGQGNLSLDKIEDLLVRHEPPKASHEWESSKLNPEP